eukprot:10020870-Karenia_brevis.AAC.1
MVMVMMMMMMMMMMVMMVIQPCWLKEKAIKFSGTSLSANILGIQSGTSTCFSAESDIRAKVAT